MGETREWYYADGTSSTGPIPETDMVQLIAAGTIQRDTLVWRVGMTTWQRAIETELREFTSAWMDDPVREAVALPVQAPPPLDADIYRKLPPVEMPDFITSHPSASGSTVDMGDSPTPFSERLAALYPRNTLAIPSTLALVCFSLFTLVNLIVNIMELRTTGIEMLTRSSYLPNYLGYLSYFLFITLTIADLRQESFKEGIPRFLPMLVPILNLIWIFILFNELIRNANKTIAAFNNPFYRKAAVTLGMLTAIVFDLDVLLSIYNSFGKPWLFVSFASLLSFVSVVLQVVFILIATVPPYKTRAERLREPEPNRMDTIISHLFREVLFRMRH